MGLVVALKHNDIVYMGCDSLGKKGNVKRCFTNQNNYRIMKVENFNNILIGHDGPILENNIIRCENLFPNTEIKKEDINFKYMVNNFVPNLFDIFNKRKVLNKENEQYSMNSELIVAVDNKIYEVCLDGCVIECDNFSVIGNGVEEALGSLISSENISDPIQRILLALKAGAKNNLKVDSPFLIINTNKQIFQIIRDGE